MLSENGDVIKIDTTGRETTLQDGRQTLPCGFNFAGRYIEVHMRRDHMCMRTEGITAFSKQVRLCSVDVPSSQASTLRLGHSFRVTWSGAKSVRLSYVTEIN